MDSSPDAAQQLALLVRVRDQPGVLHALTGIILQHHANVIYVDISDRREGTASIYFELEGVGDPAQLVSDLQALEAVREVARTPTFYGVFGKRVIVIGGGAQVGQVAVGAISEADRHNIRGEKISVDTIPLVGEESLAAAVRAVGRLPRAAAVVLAGALMGGEITQAVREIKQQGLLVVSLNMAGSVPDEADLVVSDPIQAGVMTVMAVAKTASFDIRRQVGRRY